MAIPGERACHAVMACANGTWGDIPVDPATLYVNGSYAGGGSDGSSAKPWTTIVDAVTAAAPGALIAVAAGHLRCAVERPRSPRTARRSTVSK
ncbi:MAG TPA: hypothetical protein VFB62_00905 [Polyangiaceae bacterium]|nr:hypothetical protein [Polyangiaceae bacterium]